MIGAMTRKYIAIAMATTTTTATMPESQNGRPASLSSEYVISAPEHDERALGEVHHPRRAVDGHVAEPDQPVDGAGDDAGDQQLQPLADAHPAPQQE